MAEIAGKCEARYWRRLEDGRVECTLCPRLCQLREGKRGVCFVRMAEGGEIVLTTYGRSSGFCIDPIEKKPLPKRDRSELKVNKTSSRKDKGRYLSTKSGNGQFSQNAKRISS